MKKSRLAVLAVVLSGICGAVSAQVHSIGTAAYPQNNVRVVNTSSLIVEKVPASKITAEFTDRDCPAGTTLIFDINDMNQAKCVWTYEAQRRRNYY